MSEITIKRSGEELTVTGAAAWHQNSGEVDGKARPKDDLLKVADAEMGDDGCKVELQLLGPYLLVEDNLQCGGLNVSFSGYYRRKTTK